MCGNCCTGPEGYVLVSDDECRALAARLGLAERDFLDRYTHIMMHGRSLNEKVVDLAGVRAFDCVFLDRETIPGKAICGVYEHRPAQCRTWPFWPSLLREKSAWERAKRTCPGIDKGTLVPIEEIRIRRDAVRI
jgi:Fe-S-cluster containining protein